MKNRLKQYRRGDVLLVAIDGPPKAGRAIDPEDGRVILARGEASGHVHGIRAGNGMAQLFKGPGDRRYLLLNDVRRLEHEEHGAITLEPGWYEVRRQREYDPVQTVLTGD